MSTYIHLSKSQILGAATYIPYALSLRTGIEEIHRKNGRYCPRRPQSVFSSIQGEAYGKKSAGLVNFQKDSTGHRQYALSHHVASFFFFSSFSFGVLGGWGTVGGRGFKFVIPNGTWQMIHKLFTAKLHYYLQNA